MAANNRTQPQTRTTTSPDPGLSTSAARHAEGPSGGRGAWRTGRSWGWRVCRVSAQSTMSSSGPRLTWRQTASTSASAPFRTSRHIHRSKAAENQPAPSQMQMEAAELFSRFARYVESSSNLEHPADRLRRIQPPGQRERRQQSMICPAPPAPQPRHENLPAPARLANITPVPRRKRQRPAARRAARTAGTAIP